MNCIFTKKKNWVIVILTIALMSPFVLFDLPYDSLLFTGKAADFKFSDIYANVINRTATSSSYSKDVVIVGLDGCPRDQIPVVIDTLDKRGAAVIGIDIIFKTKYDNDSILVNSLNKADAKIVLAARLDLVDGSKDMPVFKIVEKPYFVDSLSNATLGAVNFVTSSLHGVVRSFKPVFYLREVDYNINQFGAEVVKQFSTENFDVMMRRDASLPEQIKFHQNEIDNFSWKELMDRNNINVEGKIVLIGYINDINDLRVTPVDDEMPGILIHAKIIQMLLDEDYMASSSEIWNKAMALILSFMFVWILIYLSGFPNVGNLISRIIQIALLIIILIIGIRIYESRNYYIDTFYTILCIGLSQVSFDIVNSLTYIYSRIKKKKR